MTDDIHRYLITRREYNDLNAQARRLGHSWDEISKLHRMAHDSTIVTGAGHAQTFEIMLKVVIPKKSMTTFTPHVKGNTMLSNWIFRLQQWLSRWTYREHRRKRRYKNLEPSDD